MGCCSSKVSIGEKESANYYTTDITRPRLIARSDYKTKSWSKKPNVRKQVHNHPLIGLWHDPSCPLYDNVMDVIGDLVVLRMDILRVGPKGSPSPVKLLITFLPNTIKENPAWELAVECRTVLQRHGIRDVEIEINEDAWAEIRPAIKRIKMVPLGSRESSTY
ncbi:hypothetical protein ACHAQI_005586 [Fusarium lateritium]